MTSPSLIGVRVVAGAAIGGAVLALALFLLATTGLPITIGRLLGASAAAGLIAVLLSRSATTVRSLWGCGCLVNGLLSAMVAVGFRIQDAPRPGEFAYPNDLDRALGSLNHFVWAFLARAGVVFLVLATVLIALSYRLLGPPHRKA